MRTELKSHVRDLRSEARGYFSWLLGMIIGLAGVTLSIGLGLLGTMAKGFHWL